MEFRDALRIVDTLLSHGMAQRLERGGLPPTADVFDGQTQGRTPKTKFVRAATGR